MNVYITDHLLLEKNYKHGRTFSNKFYIFSFIGLGNLLEAKTVGGAEIYFILVIKVPII